MEGWGGTGGAQLGEAVAAGLAMAAETKDEPDDKEQDENGEQTDQPDGAEENDLFQVVSLVKEGEGLVGAEEAEGGGAGPGEGAGAGGGGKNDLLGETGVGAVGVGGGLVDDGAAGEEISDGEGVDEVKIQVAGILNGGDGGEG